MALAKCLEIFQNKTDEKRIPYHLKNILFIKLLILTDQNISFTRTQMKKHLTVCTKFKIDGHQMIKKIYNTKISFSSS